MFTYTPREEFKDRFIFVLGNTKYVRDCTQAEREFLYNNGRKGWFVKKIDDNSGGSSEVNLLPEVNPELKPETTEESANEVVVPAATKAPAKKK